MVEDDRRTIHCIYIIKQKDAGLNHLYPLPAVRHVQLADIMPIPSSLVNADAMQRPKDPGSSCPEMHGTFPQLVLVQLTARGEQAVQFSVSQLGRRTRPSHRLLRLRVSVMTRH